ncbi:MAG TPA: LysM domain-containing protein [Actinomycetota bacterium]|nr:LysM domain-containing protein [Actinomycetota bacterium]
MLPVLGAVLLWAASAGGQAGGAERAARSLGPGGRTAGTASDVRTYVVRPGDTLWELARALCGPEGDPRPLVDRLIAANGVEGGLIRPGEELRLPRGC